MKVLSRLILLVVLSITVAACSNSSSPLNGGSGNNVPKVGSTFTFAGIGFDTTGDGKTFTATDTSTDSIIANNVVWQGRTVSYLAFNRNTDSTGTVVESNGDISVYLGPTPLDLQDVNSKNMVDLGWVRLPVANHTDSVLRTIDAPLQDAPNVTAHAVLSVRYLGAGVVRVGAESLPVSNVRVTLSKMLTNETDTVHSTNQQDFSFSSTLGYLAATTYFHSTSPSSSDENVALKQTLLSYRLK